MQRHPAYRPRGPAQVQGPEDSLAPSTPDPGEAGLPKSGSDFSAMSWGLPDPTSLLGDV